MEEDSLFYCASRDVTPVMTQYLSVKAQYPGCLLLFRMGDFYELFFEDAKIASPLLNIALTSREKGKDIPMCGVPVAALDSYLERLVKYGYRVAICEQMEDPAEAKKRRGYKAIVSREVTRVVTAGTIIEDNLLDSRRNNFLMSLVPDICKKTLKTKTVSFAAIDISTGDFLVNTITGDDLAITVESYQPRELLMPSGQERSEFSKYVSSISNATITYLPDSKFNPLLEKERLEKYFKVKTLDSFSITAAPEMAACGSIVEYLLITQCGNFSSLPIPKRAATSNYLVLDPATSRSLEITASGHGEYSHCLLGVIDRTVTPFGARALASRVSTPIVNEALLKLRLDCVEFFLKNEKLTRLMRETLKYCPDFERAINRIRFNKFSPRDIGDIRESLAILQAIVEMAKGLDIPSEGEYSFEKLADFSGLLRLLKTALVEKLPASNRDGGLIGEGYSKKLDELQYVKNHSQELIAELQTSYISETGINALKIRSNAIWGWYVEIPAAHRSKMGEKFIQRQTLVSGVRYTTEELMALQSKLTDAFDAWSNLERELYSEIVGEIISQQEKISYAIKLLSCLDVYTNFAQLALERKYVRPVICSDPILEIEDGRHPVLEVYLKDFTHNDCHLDKNSRICLLTGPNMAGKSTYLRQNALIVLLAQIGCYVPAKKASIGIVDRLFSRIGAADDIARGRSTFLVEMIETATILNQATEKSFVILDEVGRGTSTYDGLAIAWAVMENMYKVNKCRVLFATHYRELTALESTLQNIQCKTLKVQEWNGDVIFHHKIIDGVADKSYGIHVASIAGIPRNVIKRAMELLKNFEQKNENENENANCEFEYNNQLKLSPEQMDLLEASSGVNSAAILKKIHDIDLGNTSPKNALDILYDLKELATSG
ncbi:MAG: DNA mismatch repair protein MutS [Holosporaceae bacterium]|jgi:DNA mismatch repair protein MutS|nr:DNA mismatch repair protein MutS [Holosporaceae bacterium]